MSDNAPSLLKRAADIMDERGRQYDKPGGERSMAQCVSAFNAITGRDIAEEEGWLMLAVLKMVRYFHNPGVPHRDSVEDLIAYSALFGEAALSRMPVQKREVCVKTFKDAPCVHGEKCECPPTK